LDVVSARRRIIGSSRTGVELTNSAEENRLLGCVRRGVVFSHVSSQLRARRKGAEARR